MCRSSSEHAWLLNYKVCMHMHMVFMYVSMHVSFRIITMQVVTEGNVLIPMPDGVPTIHHTAMEQRWDTIQCEWKHPNYWY